jgi:hypothetical protein
MPHEANLFDMDTATADVLPLASVKEEIVARWGSTPSSSVPEARAAR